MIPGLASLAAGVAGKLGGALGGPLLRYGLPALGAAVVVGWVWWTLEARAARIEALRADKHHLQSVAAQHWANERAWRLALDAAEARAAALARAMRAARTRARDFEQMRREVADASDQAETSCPAGPGLRRAAERLRERYAPAGAAQGGDAAPGDPDGAAPVPPGPGAAGE